MTQKASVQWRVNMIDVNRQNATSHLSAMNAATAQVVTLTAAGQQHTDFNAVGAAVFSISTNLGDFSKDVMMLTALQNSPNDNEHDNDDANNNNNDNRLLSAARKLCTTFTDFLKYVEPDCTEPRQNLFSAVSRIGEAGNEVMQTLSEECGGDLDEASSEPRLQEAIIGLAKVVASSTAGLVIASKNVANHCDSQQGVNEVIAHVTQCALSTSQLVSCTKVCSSTIGGRECQEQIVEAARQVERHVELVVAVAHEHCRNAGATSELRTCAGNVAQAVLQLLESVRASNEHIVNMSSSQQQQQQWTTAAASSSADYANGGSNKINHNDSAARQEESLEKIFQATDSLCNSMGDASEMIRQAKNLAQVRFFIFFLQTVNTHLLALDYFDFVTYFFFDMG
jgi:talin